MFARVAGLGYVLGVLVVLLALAAPAPRAEAVLIDFEQFNVGDGLSQINAVTSALGVTFEAIVPGSAVVIQTADGKALASQPDSAGADLTVNFSSGVDFVRVTFPQPPTTPNQDIASVLAVYRRNIASPRDVFLPEVAADLTFQTFSLRVPVLLQAIRKDPCCIAFQERALAAVFEQDGAADLGAMVIDNLQVGTVAEPAAFVVLGAGLVGLGAARELHRRRGTSPARPALPGPRG